jgi:uncharacterized membrane protein
MQEFFHNHLVASIVMACIAFIIQTMVSVKFSNSWNAIIFNVVIVIVITVMAAGLSMMVMPTVFAFFGAAAGLWAGRGLATIPRHHVGLTPYFGAPAGSELPDDEL